MNLLSHGVLDKHIKILAIVSVTCITTASITSFIGAELSKNAGSLMVAPISSSFDDLGKHISGGSTWSEIAGEASDKIEPFRDFLRGLPQQAAKVPGTALDTFGKLRGNLIESGIPNINNAFGSTKNFLCWLFAVKTASRFVGQFDKGLDGFERFGTYIAYFFNETLPNFLVRAGEYLEKHFDTIKSIIAKFFLAIPSYLRKITYLPATIKSTVLGITTNYSTIKKLFRVSSGQQLKNILIFLFENRNATLKKLTLLKEVFISEDQKSVFSELTEEDKNDLIQQLNKNPKAAVTGLERLIDIGKYLNHKEKPENNITASLIQSFQRLGITKEFKVDKQLIQEIVDSNGSDASIDIAIGKTIIRNALKNTAESFLNWLSPSKN